MFDGALAQLDVVLLRSCEVEDGGAELARLDDTHIDLEPRCCNHRGLRIAVADHLLDQRHRNKLAHNELWGIAGDHDVDVGDGFPESAQRSAVLGSIDRVEFRQGLDNQLCDWHGLGDRGTAILAVEPEPLNRRCDLLLRLLAHTR